MEIPETRYADSEGVSIAYQVFGDGPLDLLVAPGFISHLDMFWSFPSSIPFYEPLASFARVILFDKRGTGLSDPTTSVPTLDERIADMRVVLDAVGSEKTAIMGVSEGGPMALMFAATWPERVVALVLYGSAARISPDEGRVAFEMVAALAENWGRGDSAEVFSPSVHANPVLRRLVAVYERASASPSMVRALIAGCMASDVRSILPSIHVPTLVIHREGDRALPVSSGRELAAAIPGAKLVVLPGSDHTPWTGDYAAITSAMTQFLTGRVAPRRSDRVLTTLLFTDIVGSTERAAAMNDAAWREVLEAHNHAVRDALNEYRGNEVNTTGDGFLATFDGPARAIECAGAIREAVRSLGVEIRAGVHTGEVELLGDDVAGMAVNLAARVCAAGASGEITVTSTVKDLVMGAGIDFIDRGAHELKGVPGQWQLYAVAAGGQVPVVDDAASTEHLTRLDRTMIRIARRAPAASRFVARAAGAPK
ncbi:MAG TPA: adenylate/guanylate cyclase domain-containing protein [Acidimicrobiales bacterium]|nr:adenylate/guanylate cyclase domain-containing protein [Acidimicrobiales bacterium]